MEFGMQFFPDVGPETKSAEEYWADCLHLVGMADEYDYSHLRTVEHYFQAYGGYSPNPHVFLSAAAMISKKARLVTGAVLPIFNNPMKIAGEIGMLDALSGGRMECGFARAFLPAEFEAFGRSLNESKARFAEGMEQVRLLLEEENVTSEGEFNSFRGITSLPRPTQKPRPPFWVAALVTPDSFTNAGKMGHDVMAIPLTGGKMNELIKLYRDARAEAGHEGPGRVMLAHHMFCHEDDAKALEISRDPLNRYLRSLVSSASTWMEGTSSDDYPGYDKIIAMLAKETTETQMQKSAAFIGSPERLVDQIAEYQEITGGFEIASLQVNFNDLPLIEAERSVRLFGEKVIPKLS
ncbi:MAG: LLM class flavin-dependent oxidoreductase [Rhodospirillales bacterium]|jgi:alkanesulfonate monooxygenase SsuD/methylene tetrahydromethanopterin reductase-like flavin-dependent oxidoreductase (luciferase family)|nr:LLM class flavin-dependent oxidoreductase [Rhodospirillaceae bacterium]MDP6426678.1 LLM class flavin-dependent oxidoreductase [Rhodospirillales bacterium]MDP6645909.1 LLM class flavin-dependent oxidoreductase [Rhodospirillales bacterium]MDP6840766.1 LLM class flavin-dependent oxidoreductase [Rhodospirillales bacterium]